MGDYRDGSDPLFDHLFHGFFVVFGIVFVLVIGTILVSLGRSARQWARNNDSPRVTETAVVVAKRSEVSGGSGDSSASTWYYVTFELQGGERVEIPMADNQYGLLAEHDRGLLNRQGTRFLGFDRTPQDR
jgi:Protein of unknown function (DUF2500)